MPLELLACIVLDRTDIWALPSLEDCCGVVGR